MPSLLRGQIKSRIEQSMPYSNFLLLVFSIFTIFIIPLFSDDVQNKLFNIFISMLFFFGVMSLTSKRKQYLWFASAAFLVKWASIILSFEFLMNLSQLVSILFFFTVISRLIFQIARSKEVNTRIIAEALNGYLLLGLAFSILVYFISLARPGTYIYPAETVHSMSDFLYYTFITMTSTGYGDIAPTTSLTRSLAVLIVICGQFYLGVIIAMLVGKFTAQRALEKD